MNRRDFGKMLAAGFSVPFLGSANPENEISYRIECRIKPKTFPDSEAIYHTDFWINDSNHYNNVEDAVNQIFEHSKTWNFKKVEAIYDIIYWDNEKGFLHSGHYHFYKQKTLFEGWHTPHTNTLYLEDNRV